MNLAWYLIVICTLLCIIPALVVAVVFISKITVIRGDTDNCIIKVNAIKMELDNKIIDYNSIIKQISDVGNETHKVSVRLINIEESFVSLSNKWNSRERAEQLAEKRRKEKEEKEEKEEPIDLSQIPVEQQYLFPQQLQAQQVPVPQQSNVRKFGQIPR